MNRVDTSDEFRRSGRSLITDPRPIPGQEKLPGFEDWPVVEIIEAAEEKPKDE